MGFPCHLCDPTQPKGRKEENAGTPSTAGWIPQGGGRPRLWRVLVTFARTKVTPAERPRRGRRVAPETLEKVNPSVSLTADSPLYTRGPLGLEKS